MPLFEIFFFLLAYTTTSAKTRRLVQFTDFTVLMLLVLSEHPSEREHDTLLADGVFIPRAVTRFLSQVFVLKTERAQQVLDIEVEDQAFFHIHLPYAERSEVGAAGFIIAGEHGRGPVRIEGKFPILWQISRECSADVAVVALHDIIRCAIVLFVV